MRFHNYLSLLKCFFNASVHFLEGKQLTTITFESIRW